MCKVQLILVDGMRPVSLEACGNPYVAELLENSLSTMNAQTVMPSVTLPCHMSLFHSVDPSRHGITTNTYVPQVRPIEGLFERLKHTKRNGMFYNWEELRDLGRPDSLARGSYFSGHVFGFEESNLMVTEDALRFIRPLNLDFSFIYLGWVDEAGHAFGWMGEEYLRAVSSSFDCIRRLIENAPKDCVTIICADHGGHGRTHGTTMPEDMTIPVIIHGAGRTGTLEGEVSIKDIAPTVCHLLGCTGAPEWEGRNLL